MSISPRRAALVSAFLLLLLLLLLLRFRTSRPLQALSPRAQHSPTPAEAASNSSTGSALQKGGDQSDGSDLSGRSVGTAPFSPTAAATPPVLSHRPSPPAPATASPTPAAVAAVPEADGGVEVALDNVQFALRDYRAALGGNPVGTNPEITAALLGDNPRQLRLPLPEGSVLTAEGELADRWGTPYFFHQLSGTRMEIRSAGPDRRMWTADDLVR